MKVLTDIYSSQTIENTFISAGFSRMVQPNEFRIHRGGETSTSYRSKFEERLKYRQIYNPVYLKLHVLFVLTESSCCIHFY